MQAPVGGWPHPWPKVEELAGVLPADQWTLIGGLMTQLHAINRGIGVVRPTNDVDIVLHIEATRGVPATTAAALLTSGIDKEDGDEVDQVGAEKHVNTQNERHADIVDVLVADHAAPSVTQKLRGKVMVKVEGATQALRRTVNVVLEITPGVPITLSVPGPFGALILKAAAYQTDSRDRERHLYDAAALLACIDDPYAERESFAGSDRSRLRIVEEALGADHGAWLRLPRDVRLQAQAALRLLGAP